MGDKWERMEMAAGEDGKGLSSGGLGKKMVSVIATLVFFWFMLSVRTVPPAHVGIAVTFGHVPSGTLPSGLHFLNPFSSVVTMNLKTQLVYSENIVPTQEGLNVELDVSLLYHVALEKVREIYLQLGE